MNLNPKCSLGKANEIENTKHHAGERDFPWLVLDEEDNTMKCKICCSFPEIAEKSSSLFVGNGAFRCTTIQAHPQSKTYFTCFEANSARKTQMAHL